MKTNCTICEANQDERISMECPSCKSYGDEGAVMIKHVDHDSELKFHDEMEAWEDDNHMESMNERFLDNIGGC